MKISLRALAFIATFLLLIFLFKSCMSFSSSKKNRQKAPVNKNSEQQTKQTIAPFQETKTETNETKKTEPTKKNVSAEQKKTEHLYKRLEYAYSLYTRQNYEGALNETESMLRQIENDPYLEAQTWSLSAMIYDKQGKSSRRKRSFRKMTECIEALQKDSRYINVYKEGMLYQELFGTIKEMGGEKYAE